MASCAQVQRAWIENDEACPAAEGPVRVDHALDESEIPWKELIKLVRNHDTAHLQTRCGHMRVVASERELRRARRASSSTAFCSSRCRDHKAPPLV